MGDVITESLAHQWAPEDAPLARRLTDGLELARIDLRKAEAERDALRRHYDATAPEHNLLELLDKYEEDRCSALTQLQAALQALEALAGEVSGG